MIRIKDVKTRLLLRHKVEGDCWKWTGYTDGRYGLISIKGKEEKAHRASYQTFVGEIPKGMVIRHKCDNTLCVNPNHLELGTQLDNMKDMADRGRAGKKTRFSTEFKKSLIGTGIKNIMEYGFGQSYASRINRGEFKS